jgi:hypothetical protein
MRGETASTAPRTVEIVFRREPRSAGQAASRPNAPAQQHPRWLHVHTEASSHQPPGGYREEVASRHLTRPPSGVRWVAYAMIIALTGAIAIGVSWIRAWWAMP